MIKLFRTIGAIMGVALIILFLFGKGTDTSYIVGMILAWGYIFTEKY